MIGFFLQLLGWYLGRRGITLPMGLSYLHLMIPGIALFTLGSIQYARSKGRLWTWGLFGMAWPFFLIVVLIPRRFRDGVD